MLMTNAPVTPEWDDTKPKSPFKQKPDGQTSPEPRRESLSEARMVYPEAMDQESTPPRGMPPVGRRDTRPPRERRGCGMMGLLIGLIALFGVLIVALAGAAGWTAGKREASAHRTATQEVTIREQFDRLPAEIAACNTVLVQTRVDYLIAIGASQGNDLAATATALAINCQPTATPTFTPTESAPEVTDAPTVEVTEAPEIQITPAEGGFDLAGIFTQAQNAFNAGNYQDAIELLDVVIGVDESFQTTQVRQLMSRALNARARELFNASQPAAAIILVDRARTFGALEDGLEYEAYAATLYLNARGSIGTNYSQAIEALNAVVNLGAGGRYYQEAYNLLFQQYVAFGDAYAAQGQYCPAEQQYRNALRLSSSGSVSGKLQTAANFCANGTPTPDPALGIPAGSPPPGGDGFAPIGGG